MLRRNDKTARGRRLRFLDSVSFRLFTGLVIVAILSLVAIATAVLTLRLTVESHDQIATADLPYLSAASQLSQTANLIASSAHTLATARTEFLLRSERNGVNAKLNTLDGFLDEIRQHVEQAPESEPTDRERFERVFERRNELVINIDLLEEAVAARIEAQEQFLNQISALRETLDQIGKADFLGVDGRNDETLVRWTNHFSDLTSDTFSLSILANQALIDQSRQRVLAALQAMSADLRQLTASTDNRFESQWQALLDELTGEDNVFDLRLEVIALERKVASILSASNFVSSRFVDAVSELFFEVQSDFDESNKRVSGFVGRVSTILIAGGGVTIVLVVLLIVYVRRSVIERLTQLKDSIQSHFKGETADIPTKGTDELAQIGGALAYFVEEIKEREQRLIQARKEAEAANEAKSDFLAVVSHELRTPMYGVLAMARFLLDSSLGGEQRDYAASIVSSGETLLSLLNDILDFSKIEAGKFELDDDAFDLRYEIDSVDSLIAGSANAKGLALHVSVAPDVPNWLNGDGHRIRQVLINLAGNAVKFTKEGEIRIDVFVADAPPRDHDGEICAVRFEVSDTGVGIDEETQKVLFQPFTQADSSTAREFGGTGLGLSISHRLVGLMGGTIGTNSQPGRGSTFYFTVPFQLVSSDRVDELVAAQAAVVPAGATDYEGPGREEATKAGTVILIAEDNATNRKIIEKLVSRLGCVFDIVDNGQEAWEAFQANSYGLVLTDCRMPVMDGFELTSRIREHEQPGHRTPILALTADALQQTKERCQTVGMDDTLTKPIDFAELDKAIMHWLPAAAEMRTAETGGDATVTKAAHQTGGTKASDILDLTPLIDAFGAIDDDALDFLGRFVESADAKIQALLTRIDSLDTVGLGDLTHSLKGECFSFGGMKLGNVLEAFETDLSNAERLKRWKSEIVGEWTNLTKAAERIRNDKTVPNGPAAPPS